MDATSIFKVGEWTVTPTLCRLEGYGRSIKVKPRTMQLLAYLASRAGNVVSADELIEAVWQGRMVSDGAIYHTINQLRTALGDDREDVLFIQTVPKQGYRLVAPVTLTEPKTAADPDAGSGRPKWTTRIPWTQHSRRIAAATVVAAFLLVLFSSRDNSGQEGSVLPNSVAVLPFENLSPNPDDAYVAAGIHEEVLSQLAKIDSMNVIARSSVLPYADNRRPIREIANDLHVQSVMEGSVQFSGNQLRVTVKLIDPLTDTHLWSETYDRPFGDVFQIEYDIAVDIASALQIEFSLEDRDAIGNPPTDSIEAYAYYLRALAGSELSSRDLSAIQFNLDRAIEADPEFALAYADKASWYSRELTGQNAATPSQGLEFEKKVEAYAMRALELDATLGKAEAALAILLQVRWHADEAEAAFRRAIQLSPNDTDVLVLYGRFKRYRGEHKEAVRLLQHAVELAPNNSLLQGQLAVAYRSAGNWNAAVEAYRALLNQDPTNVGGYTNSAYVEVARGRHSEAIELLKVAEWLEPNAFRLAQMAELYHVLDRPDDARRMFTAFAKKAKGESIGAALWAQAHLAIEEDERALEYLETALEQRASTDFATLTHLADNPWDLPELNEPEFRTLLDRLWITE